MNGDLSRRRGDVVVRIGSGDVAVSLALNLEGAEAWRRLDDASLECLDGRLDDVEISSCVNLGFIDPDDLTLAIERVCLDTQLDERPVALVASEKVGEVLASVVDAHDEDAGGKLVERSSVSHLCFAAQHLPDLGLEELQSVVGRHPRGLEQGHKAGPCCRVCSDHRFFDLISK